MPIVKLPDGTLVQLPDSVEKPSFLGELGAQAKKVGASLATGAGETVGGLLQLPGLLGDVLTKNKPKDGGFVDRAFSGGGVMPDLGVQRLGKQTSEYWGGFEKQYGMEPGLPRSFVKGVGGAAVTPVGGGTKPLQTALVNLGAGGTGGVGADLGERLAPEGFKGLGALTGGLVGGGIPAFAFGPKQTVAQADIRRELEGMPESSWADAARNIDLFNSTGSQTATLAEAFPGKTRIAALAGKASTSKGGERLGHQLSMRDEDLQGLGDTFLDRISPEVDANRVANAAGGAATSNLLFSKNQATNAVTNRLAGVNVPAPQVFQIYSDLRNVAATAERATIRDAYDEVASRLLNQQGQPITNLQELSYAIKDLKDGMKNPLAPVRGGSAAMDQAIRATEAAMRRSFPDYDQAMAGFASDQAARQVVKEGPIGSLADKNPLIAGQTPVSRLEGITKGNSPQTIRQTVSTLGSPAMTMGNPATPRDIARAIAQQKLSAGSTNPGQTVRGLQGSQQEAQFSALLDAAGLNPGQTMAPLRAADQLQNLGPAGVAQGFPEMRSGQALIRPFRTIDMMMTARTERETQAAIAEYLARPTQEGLAQLREMAMFNPQIRRTLTLISALRPVAAEATNEE